MPSTQTLGRTAAIALMAVGGWLLPQGAADAATFGASWQMNEKSGPARDSTGNGNNGTVVGGVVRTGSGYDFNGSTGYVSVPNSASLNPGSAPITLRAKFSLNGNPAPSGTDYDIVRKGLASTRGGDYKMEVLASGKALCHFHGTNAAATVQGGTNLGTRTHVVQCVKTSSSVKLIVDGATKASVAVTVGSISNTSSVVLGAKPGDDFTDGLIDYIIIA
jgi:Concanavalin A-like lectin/glucanases superfamily